MWICKFAVCGILRMQEKAKGKEDDVFCIPKSKDRLQLLSDILKKWMKLSFQVPKHFFTVRSCSGAELFAFNADTTNGNKLSVKPVFHLSLNLCVQLINPPVRLRKLHCILSAKPSTETPETWDPEEAVDLYEKLMLHVSQDVNSSSGKHRRVCGGGDGSVCFNINVTGHQGFSTCLLDVSAFPVGSYKMKWQGCSTVTEGSPYWSPVPLNMGIVFSVKVPPIVSS
ncbi:hypothetical protein GIB67_013119 [Kingdonia uniflora]|uniref:Integrator complex subunit 7-like C-terminal domain-containing protein n=1 Tax=Kingdonia uniflora TaxID=39325 RepID=A0A7J7NND4_9MAGN|nr:hypothetical protein GIB67_013119 [Kingdonia uniflora]